MTKRDDLQVAIDAIRRWHYSEVRAIADAAIEACAGRERIADRDVRSIYQDAVDEGRDSDAERILQEARDAGGTETHGRERDSGADPREFMTEWVDSVTDNHEYVIYTMQAKCLLLASDNESAYEDSMGESTDNISARACMALRADVWDVLNAREDEWLIDDVVHLVTTRGARPCGAAGPGHVDTTDIRQSTCDECDAAHESEVTP